MVAEVEKLQKRYWPVGCGCCGADMENVRLTNEHAIYGRKYSKYSKAYIWICTRCKAYVGCHRDTTEPKGTLADRETRAARKQAHLWFDTIWKYYEEVKQWPRKKARGKAYKWLAEELHIDPIDCHIGMMDRHEALRVAKACEEVVMMSNTLKQYHLRTRIQ